jgi:hypothetical protein
MAPRPNPNGVEPTIVRPVQGRKYLPVSLFFSFISRGETKKRPAAM